MGQANAAKDKNMFYLAREMALCIRKRLLARSIVNTVKMHMTQMTLNLETSVISADTFAHYERGEGATDQKSINVWNQAEELLKQATNAPKAELYSKVTELYKDAIAL